MAYFAAGQAAVQAIPSKNNLTPKVRFTADTGNRVIILGMELRIKHGENAWIAEAIKKYLTDELVEQFDIKFVDPDPRIEQEEKPEKTKTTEKAETNDTKKSTSKSKSKQKTETSKTETEPVESANGEEEEKKSEVETDDGGEQRKYVEKVKNHEAMITFTAARFSKLDKERAEKKVGDITDVRKLKKVRTELEGYQGTQLHRKLIDARIQELESPAEATQE